MTSTDKSSDPWQPPTRVQIPMLVVERDVRAGTDLARVLRSYVAIIYKAGRADEVIAAFAGCNHFEAWQILIDEGMGQWHAMEWLQRWGYWPIGDRVENSTVGAIFCHKCREEIERREPCWFDVRGNERQFSHARCGR